MAAPAATGRPALSTVVFAAGALVCHQRPERSFHAEGAQLPVCARCLGLYGGGLLGVLAWAAGAGLGGAAAPRAARLLAPARLRLLIVAAAAPTMLSLVTAWLGVWDPANVLRALLALPLGAAVGGLVAAVAAKDLR